MTRRTVVIGSPARLAMDHRQLKIEREGEEVAWVPLCDLATLVLEHRATTLTVPLLAALAEEDVALVVSGPSQMPVSLALPLAGHVNHARILRGQIEAPLPRRKRLWQTVVQAKIANQAALVGRWTRHRKRLDALIPFVRSGDPDNVEGQAARAYFPLLFGRDFCRDVEAPGVNAALNYGYAVVRASVARALCGTGLHPALGIFHRNRGNAFALADDLMEPLRPLVDQVVRSRIAAYRDAPELDRATKEPLLALLGGALVWDGKRYPHDVAVARYAACFRDALLGEARRFQCPIPTYTEDSEACGST